MDKNIVNHCNVKTNGFIEVSFETWHLRGRHKKCFLGWMTTMARSVPQLTFVWSIFLIAGSVDTEKKYSPVL